MIKRIVYTFILILTSVSMGHAQKLTQYEYWIDNDYTSRTTVNSSKEDITAAIDLKNISLGVHFLNFRVRNDAGETSSPYRYIFYVPEVPDADVTLARYEYWIDNDYSNRVTANASQGELSIVADISSLETGVHFYNFRAQNTDGTYSQPYRYIFYIPELPAADVKLARYEYWIDNDYSNRVTANASQGELSIVADISSLETGVHFYNFRAQNTDGTYSQPYRYIFYIPELPAADVKLARYEYWLDNDYEHRLTGSGNQEELSLMVDISELEQGVHFYNFRAQNTDGTYSQPYRYIFYIPEAAGENDTELAYMRYSFNNLTTTLPLSGNSYEMNNYTIAIPDIMDVAKIDGDCTFTFDNEKDEVTMDRTANVNFMLQFGNKAGKWSTPEVATYTESDCIKKKAYKLEMQKTVKFDKVRQGDYEAVTFEIEKTGTYYLRSLEACTLDLYDSNGKKVNTISQKSLYDTYAIGLTAGKYFGIVYDMVKDTTFTADQVGLRLMLTANYVPSPEIAYSNETVTITCPQEDVKIYYTVDGTDPTTSSTLYTVPFEMKQNATIKAVAMAEGFADSYVGTLKIDCYKVETPIIEFANLKVYISCTTPNSRIYYSLDGKDPLTDGERYTEPISVSQNCVVRAVAKRDGYNNSDEARYDLDVTNVKCVTPELAVVDNVLTITSLTTGARIYYTIDGSVPTTSSTLYTTPILLDHNCTYKAIAVKDGELTSEMSEYTVDWFQAVRPAITFEDGTVTITCTQKNVKIFYTTDGTTPTAGSTLYTEPFNVSGNGMIKAFSVAEGFIDSDVAEYEIGSYKVGQPEMEFTRMKLYLTCSTPGAKILYTLDNSNPLENGMEYKEPILLSQSVIVRAVGVYEGYNNSDELYHALDFNAITCATPVFTHDSESVTISCATEGATIYYTMDGTEPTENSSVYTAPIRVEHNCTIKALAVKNHWIDSSVGSIAVDWFTVATPVFTLKDSTLTITCETPGSKIYYAWAGEEPTRESLEYTAPIKLVDNRTVKAFAVKDDFNDSEVETFTVDLFKCAPAEIAYNGRYVTLTTETENATIYYTLDGSEPTDRSIRYTNVFELEGITSVEQLPLIRTLVKKAYTNDSELSQYKATAIYSGGKDVYVGSAGSLSKAFEWTEDEVCDISVHGALNSTDVTYLRGMSAVSILDLNDATFTGNTLQDKAFADMKALKWVTLPSSLKSVGGELFSGCGSLAAITWNPTINIPDDIIGDMKLPNLLLYVKASGYVSSRFGNVIVNGIASAITLADDTQSNFFCPEQFTARSIQYTHNFTQQTVPGVCQGWESIALPFAPQKFEHEKNGEIAPFASASDGKKPFWLYKYTEDGFVRTDAMDANVAYIISMPNNDVYADAYMLGGSVTFSAVNTAVKASNDVIVSERGLIGFYPNFTHQNTDNGMMVVNVGEEYMGHAEGSVFVSGLRYIRPFEGYMHTATAGSRAIMKIFEDSVTDGIDDILAKTDVRVWLEDGVLKAECSYRSTLPIRDINGRILRTEVLHYGINTINDLPNGLYIVNGRKYHIHGR